MYETHRNPATRLQLGCPGGGWAGAESPPDSFSWPLHGAPGFQGPQSEHHSEGLDLPGTHSNVANGAASRKPDPPGTKKPHAGLCRYLGQHPLSAIHGGWGSEGSGLGETYAQQTWPTCRAGEGWAQACGGPRAARFPALCIPVTWLRPCHPPSLTGAHT